ncbi:hypothetical protein LSTR_LSTR013809 [Laodelphax striatellus]|uniref:Thymidine phosphorylase n=1 Tax=Laodelphax striatellus TaxID=195883 RepID=A0A482XNP8_LAOST|nr:hypothetical protein LSTR_LSTR013809 [Laodelphax striatellus]
MDMKYILRKKRDGEELSEEEIKFFIKGVSNGTIHEAQIGAMLMAIFIKGMTQQECVTLTKEMVFSGDTMQWPAKFRGSLVDKHSTGGVGDKVSIPLAPALAACGLKVPMLTGRCLSFTGGTLDKLESIPGFRISLTDTEMQSCLEEVGCFMMGTTERICPADKVLYKIRDLTSTVDYYNLIASSILSKKASEGIDYLIMDLKVGSATFMKDVESARVLAHQKINLSKLLGFKTRILLTRHETPLGRCVGNSLEIFESIEILRGKNVPLIKDLILHIGGHALHLSGKTSSVEEGELKMREVLENGKALECFKNMLIKQGVSEEVSHQLCFGDTRSALPQAKYQTRILAQNTGWINRIEAFPIGKVCYELGKTNENSSDTLNRSTGVELLKTVDEFVEINEPWILVHHSEEQLNEDHINALKASITISSVRIEIENQLIEVIGEDS